MIRTPVSNYTNKRPVPCRSLVIVSTMTLVVPFPGTARTSIDEVGGKGYSLIRMSAAGLPVPPGVVLTTAFFAPWFERMRESATWQRLATAPSSAWPDLGEQLKALAETLPFPDRQRSELAGVRRSLVPEGALVAVRSSSPQEDLASASFAGGYETRLGVGPDQLDEAVRHCFASSLDARVFLYKQQHGFDVLASTIAVVVQRQLDSDIAGVGFSLNPQTNDFDEAVISANWGLGESVVSGQVTPDHFVVDKLSGEVLETRIGTKQVAIVLDPAGGTVERNDSRAAEPALDEEQLSELNDTLCRIESLYGMPMDIEWAFADGRLSVLQARPITTYVPLPEEMITAPGERRRLYADAALSKGMTTNAPISPLGLDWMARQFFSLIETFIGPFDRQRPIADSLIFAAGGRLYANFSNLLWLRSSKALARQGAASDALMAETMLGVDDDRYRSSEKPAWAGWRLLWIVPGLMWRLRGFFWRTAKAILAPESTYRTYQEELAAFERMLRETDAGLPLEQLEAHFAANGREMFDVTMSVLMAGFAGMGTVVRVAGATSVEDRALAEKMTLGLPGNVVVEMGIELYRLSGLIGPDEFADLDGLAQRVAKRRMPEEFLKAWDAFIDRFGWRGPLEMDLASSRYADAPGLALRQMSFMGGGRDSFDPAAWHEHQVRERQRAFEHFMARAGWLRRRLLRRAHRLVELFAGTRDTPKHLQVLVSMILRRRILARGRELVDENRLDACEHVFELAFDELATAESDPALDLRALREARLPYLNKLKRQVTVFPQVIDSRGRILRPPPRADKPGELSGMAVSPGVTRGPVKVLHDPHEKPVEEGDVLVAYTTDPGWTPLFVNAAAVVLEVGGILQHGAVVAREYGKPCVVGIDRGGSPGSTMASRSRWTAPAGSSGSSNSLPNPPVSTAFSSRPGGPPKPLQVLGLG